MWSEGAGGSGSGGLEWHLTKNTHTWTDAAWGRTTLKAEEREIRRCQRGGRSGGVLLSEEYSFSRFLYAFCREYRLPFVEALCEWTKTRDAKV